MTVTGAGLASWQARIAFTEKAHAEDVRDFLTTILREASPYEGDWKPPPIEWLKQARDRINDRFSDRPQLRVALLNIVGSSLLTLQDTAAAEAVLRQAVADARQHLGDTHPETLRARVLLTPVYRFRGNTRQMRLELDEVLPRLRARPDMFAEHLAIALKNQAHLEIDEGRYVQAERAAQEGLDVALQHLDERHPETVASFLMVALTFHRSRSPEVALPAAERAYRKTIAAYPNAPTHPRMLEARLMYGRALAEAGHLTEGVEQLTHAVDDAARVFGPTSRMVGFFSVPLVKFQVQSGRIEEALESSRKALEIIGQHSAVDSFRYASALHARGVALLSAGRPAEALPLADAGCGDAAPAEPGNARCHA